MPFAGNLRTLPLPDVFQTLNNIKATGVLRLRSSAGSRDVVFQQGEIIGVGFLDKSGREELALRLTLLGLNEQGMAQRMQGVTWYWSAMQARGRASKAELDELVHEQAREQLHNLFAWNNADFDFDESGPDKEVANELVAHSLERPLSIDTATLLLEAARQQDEWAELRARIRDEAGQAAMGSQPTFAAEPTEPAQPEDPVYHLYLDGEWRGPFPRSEIIGLVQTGEVPTETWSYDPRTQERETLDKILGSEARRITPEELDALKQAVRAAEARLNEERAGRSADLAEMRGLAGEVLRVARETTLDDPALSAVVGRLSEAMGGDDPSLVALAAETVVVSLVRHLRDGAGAELTAARGEAGKLAGRIAALERDLAAERKRFDGQLAEVERQAETERAAAEVLRGRLASAAEDAARLDQELERMRRDPSRVSTARISALKTPEDVAAARSGAGKPPGDRSQELVRELGRMRAEHARLLNEIASLQTRFDDEHSRHEAELEASRALAATLGEQQGGRTPQASDAEFQAEIERLKRMLAEAESKAGSGSDLRRAVEERERAAAERDAARGDTQRLRRDLHQARAEAARIAELSARAEASEARVAEAEARAEAAESRLREAEGRLRSTESDLAEARAKLEAAELARNEANKQAYESARQNTQLQVRVREFANRLDEGERRLAEFGDLAGQLAEARARAAALADEGQRIRTDVAAVREAATGRLDRARARIAQLKAKLKAARRQGRELRDISASRVAVPWPSPATAMYAAAPQAPMQQVPWPSPPTAMYVAPPQAAPAPAPAPQPALSPLVADPPAPRRAAAESDRVPTVRFEATAERRGLPAGLRWSLAAAAGLGLLVAGTWYTAVASLPLANSAVVNARLVQVPAAIPGVVSDTAGRGPQSVVRRGDLLASVRNQDIDRSRFDALNLRLLALKDRQENAKASLARAQAERDRLAQDIAAKPEAPENAERGRLRDEYSARVVELQGSLEDLRQRQGDLVADIASEQRRIDSLRESEVRSPVDGVVWSLAKQSVPAGAEVCTVADSDSIVVEAEVDAGWRNRLAVGSPARVRVGDTEVVATVRTVDPPVSEMLGYAWQRPPADGAVRVLLEIQDPQVRSMLKIGRPARVAITGADPGLLTRLALALRF